MRLNDITHSVSGFLDTTSLNRVEEIGIDRIFDKPLFGTAHANDSLFSELKNSDVIGPEHMLPIEWLSGAKTVISYFLPFSEDIRKANFESGLPAVKWVYGRIEGEECNDSIREYIVSLITANDGRAITPALDQRFSVVDRRSNWSERHIAFISGLGTFGLSKSLITKKGCAGRYGSVITDLEMEPTVREYSEIYEYCNMCGECISRCPSEAIKKEGKNTLICSQYLDDVVKPAFKPRYGCGKCQTAVPCEYKIP